MAVINLTDLPFLDPINTGHRIFLTDGTLSYQGYLGDLIPFVDDATSGNLEATGTALQNQIDAIEIGEGGSVFGLATSGDLENTGTALQNQLDDKTGNYYGIGQTDFKLYDAVGAEIIDWNSRIMTDSSVNSINWGNRILYNGAGDTTLSWENRALYNSILATTVDWQNRLLTGGTWYASDLVISGQGVLNAIATTGNYVTGVSITGGIAVQEVLNINAGANVTLTQINNNTFEISAAASSSTGIFSGVSTGLKAVKCIDELRGFDYSILENGDTILVNSYYNNGSERDINAGGLFIWRSNSAENDDGGRFINPSGNVGNGRYERQINGAPYITYWGARGNATGDDTQSIQAAFDALNFDWSTEMRIPNGVYDVYDTIYKGSCRRLVGEGGWSTIRLRHNGHGIAGEAFRIWDKLTDDSNSPYYYQLYYEHGFRCSDVYIKGNNALFPGSATGAGLALYTPGETAYVDNVATHYNGYGILSVGGGAPGLRCKTISAHNSSYAVVGLKPLYYNSGWQGKTIVACDIDTLSMDGNQESIWSGMRVLDIWNCLPTVTFKNVKTEGYLGGGIVQWTPPLTYAWNTPVGQLVFEGGSVQRNPAIGGTGKCALVKIMPPTGAKQAYNYPTCSRSPLITLRNINQSAIDYLIEDQNLLTWSGDSFKVYPESPGGLHQAEAMTPITYSAATYPTWEDGHIHRNLRKDGKIINRFTPVQTGWYRIARGIKNSNVGLGGSFDIYGPTNSGTYVKFDCFTNNTQSYIKIRNSSPLVNSTKIGNQITAVRCGTLPTYPNTCIDIAIEYPFSSSDNPRDFYLEVISNDTRSHWSTANDYHFFVDPWLITGSNESNFSYVDIAHTSSPAQNDLQYNLTLADSGNIQNQINNLNSTFYGQAILPTGSIQNHFCRFSTDFQTPPQIVVGSIMHTGGDSNLHVAITSIVESGFYLNSSDIFYTTGYFYNFFVATDAII